MGAGSEGGNGEEVQIGGGEGGGCRDFLTCTVRNPPTLPLPAEKERQRESIYTELV